jgi:hypothetical protein
MSLFEISQEERAKANEPQKPMEPLAPHPEGDYDGVISLAKVKHNERKGEYVLLMVETRAGKAFADLSFNNKTVAFTGDTGPKTFADLAKAELKKIIMSAYKKTAVLPTKLSTMSEVATELKGLPVRIKVTHKPGKDGKTYVNVRFGKVNEIDRIESKTAADSNEPALTAETLGF